MAKATKEAELSIKHVTRPVQFNVSLACQEGSAMLQNKMPDLSFTKAEKKDQVKRDYVELERENWRDKLYIGSNGDVVMPGENIHECIISGAAYWGEKAKGNKSFKQIFRAGVVVGSLDLGIKSDDPTVVPFGKMVNGNPSKGKGSGAKVYKIRPLIRPWSGSFDIWVFDGRISREVLHTVLVHCGMYVGLSDWRPTFGRFDVVDIKEVE